jgi:hypothetical protein
VTIDLKEYTYGCDLSKIISQTVDKYINVFVLEYISKYIILSSNVEIGFRIVDHFRGDLSACDSLNFCILPTTLNRFFDMK